MEFPDSPEIGLTNMQCWAMQAPVTLFPTDGYHFPPIITSNVAQPDEQSNRVDGIAIQMRATGINEIVATHVVFFRTTNSMKPFLSPVDFDTNGHPNFLITLKQLEDSQR